MKKLIDLTHVIDPDVAGRKFEVKTIGADEVNQNVVRLSNQWYIMHDISMVNHLATHIESPYHLYKDGLDLSTMPLETFCGAAVLLDLRGCTPGSPISVEDVRAAAEKAGGIQNGDIVFCNLGFSDKYGTPEYSESPYFTNEAITWLAGSGMKMMGVDAGGVEIPKSEEHVNHCALLSKNIPLIENVANLNHLPCERFTVYAFPYPMRTIDSFPLRVVAEIG